jgi:primosomal protein N' (replication factor Y)
LTRSSSRVEVALPLPIHRTFTYRVEGRPPPIGTRVVVPFRREERIGWVVGPGSDGAIQGLRSVLSVLEERPSVPSDLLELCRWMASYYVAPLGIALRAALPSVLTDVSRDYVSIRTSSPRDLTSREAKLVEWLRSRGAAQRVRSARRALAMGSIWPEVAALAARGVVAHETVPPSTPAVRTRRVVRIVRHLPTLAEREELFGRADRQREAYALLEASGGTVELMHLMRNEGFSRSVVKGLEHKGLVALADREELRDPFADTPRAEPPALTPTPAQSAALAELATALRGRTPAPFLLHGVTGSGKTLVYIELLREVLAMGRGAIVLVPEIALTPQTVSRFRAHFGDQVAVIHSRLSDGERYDAWRQLRAGTRRIAIGARSALFAPIAEIGVVVVDEEHDSSYKQSESPRYHARDLAVVRARAHGAVCLLGSATPSLESWHNVHIGKFRRLVLPERIGGRRLPEVCIVDLRAAHKREPPEKPRPTRGAGVLSEELISAVDQRLHRQEQVILLLNRRGYSSFVQCRVCGDVEQCRNCSISLTYHRVTHRLVCHHCRFERAAPQRCPSCGSQDLSYRGLGTEQVERVTTETFPDARVARMDVDTTSGKWAHQRILERVERGEVDILLGTQMIAKGLDFPRVTLVGVVSADVGIHLPDFRASERTFQLLSQVAGRAGRGELGGDVIIQTSLPDHYAIRAAMTHDYEAFAAREIAEREGPRYPPHVRLVNAVVSSPDRGLAARVAEKGAAWMRAWLARAALRGRTSIDLVGPAPAPIERLHGRWRWHFMMRSPSSRSLGTAAQALALEFRQGPGDVRVALDRDPVALL